MILKASQRGGAAQLGAHLLKDENEHVEVHEIRGFASNDLMGAMREANAVAKGTRCKQFLFSVSLSPPQSEAVPFDAFEAAINRIEEANGLTGQPRVVVFHTKEARIHCHAVWSRIDAETMTARPLPFFKTKLREVSKALYLEHGWQMPRGLVDSKERDPRNFNLAEWQAAKRMDRNPGQLKATIQECWAMSDSRDAFEKALESRGLYLAKGDHRAHVAITYEGEVLSIAKAVGKRTKVITAKLGKPDDARNVEETRAHIASVVAPRLEKLIAIARASHAKDMAPLRERRMTMRDQHGGERQRLDDGQRTRAAHEAKRRAARFRGGVAGLWDRMTGRHAGVIKQNEAEAYAAFRRDRDQRQELVQGQLVDRRALQRDIVAVRHRYAASVTELHRDLAQQDRSVTRGGMLRDSFSGAATRQAPSRVLRSSRSQTALDRSGTRTRGPELGR